MSGYKASQAPAPSPDHYEPAPLARQFKCAQQCWVTSTAERRDLRNEFAVRVVKSEGCWVGRTRRGENLLLVPCCLLLELLLHKIFGGTFDRTFDQTFNRTFDRTFDRTFETCIEVNSSCRAFSLCCTSSSAFCFALKLAVHSTSFSCALLPLSSATASRAASSFSRAAAARCSDSISSSCAHIRSSSACTEHSIYHSSNIPSHIPVKNSMRPAAHPLLLPPDYGATLFAQAEDRRAPGRPCRLATRAPTPAAPAQCRRSVSVS